MRKPLSGDVFMVIVLFSGVKAVWNSFNRLFSAFGQATGGTVVTRGGVAVAGAGAVDANDLADCHLDTDPVG